MNTDKGASSNSSANPRLAEPDRGDGLSRRDFLQ